MNRMYFLSWIKKRSDPSARVSSLLHPLWFLMLCFIFILGMSLIPQGAFHRHHHILTVVLWFWVGDWNDVFIVRVALWTRSWVGQRSRRKLSGRDGAWKRRGNRRLHTNHRRVIALQKTIADLSVFLRKKQTRQSMLCGRIWESAEVKHENMTGILIWGFCAICEVTREMKTKETFLYPSDRRFPIECTRKENSGRFSNFSSQHFFMIS